MYMYVIDYNHNSSFIHKSSVIQYKSLSIFFSQNMISYLYDFIFFRLDYIFLFSGAASWVRVGQKDVRGSEASSGQERR